MRDDRNPEPLTGTPDRLGDEPSAIDREIEQALDVQPSPEFVARVRMRVANEPAPRRAWVGWTTWMPVTAGVLLAATVVMMIVAPHPKVGPAPGSDRVLPPAERIGASTPAPATGPSVTPAAVPSAVASSTSLGARPSTPLGAGGRTPKAATTVGRAEPEVLISEDESNALRRLFARASRGELGQLSLPSEVADAQKLPPEIVIDPVKIEPLVPQTNGEGVRQ